MREVDPDAKRRAILDAALTLFDQRGFYGTSVPVIATQARVGAGTVYRNFASKEELVNVLYREAKTRLIAFLLEGFPGEGSTRQQFSHLWWRLVAFAREHGASLAFTEVHYHAEYLDAESHETSLLAHARFLDVIRQGQARQDTAATVAAAVVLLLLVAAGLWVYNRRIKNAALYALQNVTTTADWQLTDFRSHLKGQMALPWRKIEFDKPVTDDDLATEAVQELLKDANRANKNDDDNDNEDDEDYNQYLK